MNAGPQDWKAAARFARKLLSEERNGEAEQSLRSLIEEIEASLGPDAVELVAPLYIFAESIKKQHPWNELHSDERVALTRALEIIHRRHGVGSTESLHIRETLATRLGAVDDLGSAIEHMTAVVEIKRRLPTESVILAHAINGLADMHLRAGHYGVAASLYESAFAMAGGRGDEWIDCVIWYGLGRALIGMGRFEDAIAPLESVYGWARDKYGEHGKATKEFRRWLERAREGLAKDPATD